MVGSCCLSGVLAAMVLVVHSVASIAKASMIMKGVHRIMFERFTSTTMFWAMTTVIPTLLVALTGFVFLDDFRNDRRILSFEQARLAIYCSLFAAVAVTAIFLNRQVYQTLDEFKKLKASRVELGVITYVSTSSAAATTLKPRELSLEKGLLICRYLLIVISIVSSSVGAALLTSTITTHDLVEHPTLAFFPWLTYDVFPGFLMFTAHLLLVLWFSGNRMVARLIDKFGLDSPKLIKSVDVRPQSIASSVL